MVLAQARASDPGVRSQRALRYRTGMRKNTRKLGLHSETVRTLDRIDLARAMGGGNGNDPTQSGINCVAQAAVAVPK